jgi:hypothetical protein
MGCCRHGETTVAGRAPERRRTGLVPGRLRGHRRVPGAGYTGSLLTWTGFALTSRSVPVLALVGGLLGRAYQRRIHAEEQLLNRELPGYSAYQDRTKKLVPYLW